MAGRVFSLPVQRTIVDGLQEVGGGDAVRLSEVGDRPGDAEDAVVGSSGEIQFFHRAFEKIAARIRYLANFLNLLAAHLRIGVETFNSLESLLLNITGFDDTLAYIGTFFRFRLRYEFVEINRNNLYMQVYPV